MRPERDPRDSAGKAPGSRLSAVARLKIDPYLLAIFGMVVLASVLPARGTGATLVGHLANACVALLFFLYGGRLSAHAVRSGISDWRLQLTALACTFVLFPLLGLVFGLLAGTLLSPELARGIVFLGVLPSTVQSSIAFTSIARGNIAAAVCCASLSNLVGILATPLLVGLLFSAHGQGLSLDALGHIVLQLFVPFALGQALRPWIGRVLERHRRTLSHVDRISILLVVYAVFSDGVAHGLWHQVSTTSLVLLLIADGLLLASVLAATTFLSRRLGFARADEIAIVFCGSKKSLASGVPMASVLFTGTGTGLLILPLMLFHQIQLMACAFLAQRYAAMEGRNHV